jgi:hypothetical protein
MAVVNAVAAVLKAIVNVRFKVHYIRSWPPISETPRSQARLRLIARVLAKSINHINTARCFFSKVTCQPSIESILLTLFVSHLTGYRRHLLRHHQLPYLRSSRTSWAYECGLTVTSVLSNPNVAGPKLDAMESTLGRRRASRGLSCMLRFCA